MRLLRATTARVSINAFARTPILAQRVLGTLLPRLVSFALFHWTAMSRASLRPILRASAARRLAASAAGLPIGYATRSLASIPLFHGTAYLGAPPDAISNGMESS